MYKVDYRGAAAPKYTTASLRKIIIPLHLLRCPMGTIGKVKRP